MNRRWRCTCEPEANQKRLATNPSGSDTFPVLLQFNQGEKEKLPAWLVTMGRGGSEARSSMSLLVNHTMSLYVLVRRSVPHLFPKNVQTDDELWTGGLKGLREVFYYYNYQVVDLLLREGISLLFNHTINNTSITWITLKL